MTEFFTDVYYLEPQVVVAEVQRKEERLLTWHSLRIDIIPFQVTLERMHAALKKLKSGKSSPDGCTAEMFCSLPTEVLLQLCTYFTPVLATLDIPESWGTVGAALIPKVVGAASLAKFRAIACLPVARKLLGTYGYRCYRRCIFLLSNVVSLRAAMPRMECTLSKEQQS